MNRDGRPEGVLIYVHLPKAGGTTLNRVIEAEYPVSRIYCIDPAYHARANRRLRATPDSRLQEYDAFIGHMPFGLHERLERKARYITVFRDPVARMISAYRFARSYRIHPRHKLASGTSLLGFLEAIGRHNVQTGLLAGTPLGTEVDGQALERAISNLDRHFVVAGLTERFDETLALLKLRFAWKIEQLGDFNVTSPSRAPKERVPDEDKRQIAEWNALDVKLYDLAKTRFEKEISADRAAIDEQLEALSRAKAAAGRSSWSYYTGATVRKTAIRLRSLFA
jgi:hypothetical protein